MTSGTDWCDMSVAHCTQTAREQGTGNNGKIWFTRDLQLSSLRMECDD